MDIQVLVHSSIRIEKEGKVIYFDPFKVIGYHNDADYIFITHPHYDHYSLDDIERIRKDDTVIIGPEEIGEADILVWPNESYSLDCGIKFSTVPAYNIDKQFHLEDYNWVGYIIELEGIKYYISGDTDGLPENQNIDIDVAFLPIGGTFTMNVEEAATYASKMKAKKIIPTHYGDIVGDKSDGDRFKELIASLNPEQEVEVHIY